MLPMEPMGWGDMGERGSHAQLGWRCSGQRAPKDSRRLWSLQLQGGSYLWQMSGTASGGMQSRQALNSEKKKNLLLRIENKWRCESLSLGLAFELMALSPL